MQPAVRNLLLAPLTEAVFAPLWAEAQREALLPTTLHRHDLLARLPDQRVDKASLTQRLFLLETREMTVVAERERVAHSMVSAYLPLFFKTVLLVYQSRPLPAVGELLKAWNDQAQRSVDALMQLK